jgi:hypothetical protein
VSAAGVLVTAPALGQSDPEESATRETVALSAQEGVWTVTDTFWARPGGAPVGQHGLGRRPAHGGRTPGGDVHAEDSSHPLRIDYLGYDATAGQ